MYKYIHQIFNFIFIIIIIIIIIKFVRSKLIRLVHFTKPVSVWARFLNLPLYNIRIKPSQILYPFRSRQKLRRYLPLLLSQNIIHLRCATYPSTFIRKRKLAFQYIVPYLLSFSFPFPYLGLPTVASCQKKNDSATCY